jgi:hypothetical protein
MNFGDFATIEVADPNTFKDLGHGYAQDARHLYSGGTALEGVGDRFAIDGCGFLHGEEAVYHYSYRLPLDAESFEVLNVQEKLKEVNPGLGEFLLKDRNETYRYTNAGTERQFARIE